MLNKIYIHYITTLFVLESFIISCWLLKGKKIGIGIGIGQFARKKSVSESESASLLEKNRYRNRPRKIMIGASLIFCIIIGWMCVHSLPTHIYVQTTCKVNFASDDPFKKNVDVVCSCMQNVVLWLPECWYSC